MLAQKSRYFTLGDCFSLNFVGQSVTLSPYMGGEVRKTIVMTERRKKKQQTQVLQKSVLLSCGQLYQYNCAEKEKDRQ